MERRSALSAGRRRPVSVFTVCITYALHSDSCKVFLLLHALRSREQTYAFSASLIEMVGKCAKVPQEGVD